MREGEKKSVRASEREKRERERGRERKREGEREWERERGRGEPVSERGSMMERWGVQMQNGRERERERKRAGERETERERASEKESESVGGSGRIAMDRSAARPRPRGARFVSGAGRFRRGPGRGQCQADRAAGIIRRAVWPGRIPGAASDPASSGWKPATPLSRGTAGLRLSNGDIDFSLSAHKKLRRCAAEAFEWSGKVILFERFSSSSSSNNNNNLAADRICLGWKRAGCSP